MRRLVLAACAAVVSTAFAQQPMDELPCIKPPTSVLSSCLAAGRRPDARVTCARETAYVIERIDMWESCVAERIRARQSKELSDFSANVKGKRQQVFDALIFLSQ